MKKIFLIPIIVVLVFFAGIAGAPLKVATSLPKSTSVVRKASTQYGKNARQAAQASSRLYNLNQNGFRNGAYGIGFNGLGYNGITGASYSADSVKRSLEKLQKRHQKLLSAAKRPNLFSAYDKRNLLVPGVSHEEIFNNIYYQILQEVMKGTYDDKPLLLLEFADYCKRKSDEVSVVICLDRLQTDKLTPVILEDISRRFPSLREYMPDMTRAVTVNAYTQMLTARIHGVDCDSARMQQGDTLMMVAGSYLPHVVPLVELSCFYNPAKEIELYKEVADSVTANYGYWSPTFRKVFGEDLFLTLKSAEEYTSLLDYFGREPLKEFPDSSAAYSLELATCAFNSGDGTQCTYYIQKASELDPVAAMDYSTSLYNIVRQQFITDLNLTDSIAEYLVYNVDMPASAALQIASDISAQYLQDIDTSWEWSDESDISPERLKAINAIIYLIDKGMAFDEGRSPEITRLLCRFMEAGMIGDDPSRVEKTEMMLENLLVDLADADTPEKATLRCCVVIELANRKAQGLESPKDGLKYLKKNLKFLDTPGVDPQTRADWYDYMAALATRLGKTKDAAKYLKMKDLSDWQLGET